MAPEHSFAEDFAPAEGDAAEGLRLLRRYEPVLRFTRGELFFPMAVPDYLRACSLWQSGPALRGRKRRGTARQIRAPGELCPARLAETGAALDTENLSLRFVQRPLGHREYRAWRRGSSRPRLASGGSRFAAVGLVSRLIDAAMRLSLLVRGRVPGGTAAAAEQTYRARADPAACTYYGRVSRDRGFVALQYWFLYAMNDWRSTFAGVNDHEADWEQVTLFLPDPPDAPDPPGPPGPPGRPAWIAFSSHDEAGDDLRRRHDDPDLEWHGTHPVVYAGAGSHSGAYLPGDYLVTVEPPALRKLIAAARRLSRLFLPWTRAHAGTAFGIPFIDYRRGDGPAVGPGQAREWNAVLVDDATPWVRDYRGLWGLDTGDPFGGERAPAGPRYERDGSVRACWSDPVGWAGLDKETPSPKAERQAIEARMAGLDRDIAAAGEEIDRLGDELRGAQVGIRALRAAGLGTEPGRLAELEASIRDLRLNRRARADERGALARALVLGLRPDGPHAHLRHRALPNVDPARTRRRVLRMWSATSASFLLAGLAVIVLGHAGALLPALAGLAFVMLCVEAFARGHLVQFVAGLFAAAFVVALAWAVAVAALGNWREVLAAMLALGALVLLAANVRDFFVSR